MRKIAVITGAGAGVGRATAEEFARQGYDVALLSRDSARLHRAAEALEAYSIRALPIPTDVADAAAVEAAAECAPSSIARSVSPRLSARSPASSCRTTCKSSTIKTRRWLTARLTPASAFRVKRCYRGGMRSSEPPRSRTRRRLSGRQKPATQRRMLAVPAQFNFLLGSAEVPMGLVIVGLPLSPGLAFGIYVEVWQRLDYRRQSQELQAQRALADDAEVHCIERPYAGRADETRAALGTGAGCPWQ
jgi:hypothetical protein